MGYLQYYHRLDVNQVDTSFVSLLCIAAHNSHLHVIEFLLDEGGNINLEDINRKTPLAIACQEGHLPVVYLLLG